MGELTGVLNLLQQTAHLDEDLVVICDSTYAIKSITEWIPSWKRRGWKKADGKPVQNLDIMKALDQAMQGRRVRFEWVKGHSGHELNEAADRLANAAAAAYKEGREADPGPGFAMATGAVTVVPSREAEEEHPDLFAMLSQVDEHPVIAAERALLSAEVRRDRAAVAAYLHPQWCEIGRSGRLWDRAGMVEKIAPLASEVSLDVISLAELAPDTVLLIWRALGERTTLRSSIWVRTAGRWQQRFHQATDER